MVDAPADFHQTIIPRLRAGDEDAVLVAAKKLADKLRAKRAYTNTATFDLKCQVSDDHGLIMPAVWLYGEILNWVCFFKQDCGQGLKGEKEARQHASQTGHVNFGEY